MTELSVIASLPPDDRAGQAERVADFMDQHPEGVTTAQIETACEPGSVTKLLSVMRKSLGYAIRREWVIEICQSGTKKRRRYRFYLKSRPDKKQQDLFPGA